MKTRFLALILIVFFILSVLSVGQVKAVPTTITWTSTSDFDSGNKSDPGQSYFASNGVDQPSNWVSGPRSWWVSSIQTLYTVWQGDYNYKIFIASWNKNTNTWNGPFIVEPNNPISPDGHGSPSIAVTNDGYINVFCCSHASQQLRFRSVQPYDITSFTQLSSVIGEYSYPNLFVASNGTFYWFYRKGFSHVSALAFRYSLNNGLTFSQETIVVDFRSNTRGIYFSNIEHSSDFNQVYFMFSWAQAPAGDKHDLYYARYNLVTNTIYNITGSNLGHSVDLVTANSSMMVVKSGAFQLFYPALHFVNNNPFVIYLVEKTIGGSINVNWTKWNGSIWTANATIFNTASANNMGDFRVINSTDIRAFYPLSKYDITGGGVLYEWYYNGVSWLRGKQIMGSQWSHAAMFTPNLPDVFVFDEREPGTGSPTSRLWAYDLTTGFIYRKNINSGTYGVETITDNSRIPANSFELANPLSDTFKNNDADARTFKWDTINYTGYSGCQFVNSSIKNSGFSLSLKGSFLSACDSGIVTAANFTGDLNISIKVTRTFNDTPGQGQWELSLLDLPGFCSLAFPQINGAYIIVTTIGIDVYKCLLGSPIFLSSAGISTPNPVYLRITRVSNVYGMWYSINGLSYSQINTFNGAIVPVWSVISQYAQSSNKTTSGFWTNFNIVTGSVNQWGYRSNGSWVSPVVSYLNDSVIARNITVLFSGASVSRYIDRIEVLNKNNIVIYSNVTKITVGSSVTIHLPSTDSFIESARVNWKIRISLAGDGIGSINISEISVQTGLIYTYNEIVSKDITTKVWDGFVILVFISLVVLFFVAAFGVRKYRGRFS